MAKIKRKQSANIPNYDVKFPLFSFQYLDKTHGLDSCNKDEKAALVSTLYKLSQCRWKDLRNAPRHGVGYEKIDRHSFRVAIPQHITEDVNIIAFRFSGKKPMIGYRDKAIFHIVWLDRSFEVYNHE
ncbi:hypothetical protein [Roseofilum sp. Guam]|uniref:hypothetical protein n=1 Tax=Roseofilum sp. Guam TaxID=2821502 RepID=UPI001B233397|nr:hypothetical protein [Roseofilum sp. Guam]MBP0027514.1 hypothetical protein [Roseofilum sp. Guam]